MAPLISVIINTYNYGRFIEKAIDSVLNQTFPQNGFEIIVVDDGSTDGTPEIVKKYKDKIKYIYKENGGQASAFNTGFENATGDIIVFLDADDCYYSNKLERIDKKFRESGSIDVAYHYFDLADKDDRVILEWPDRRIELEKHPLKNYLNGNMPYTFPTSSICVRSDCLRKIMPIPECFNICADTYLMYILPFVAREFALIEEKLASLISHDNSYWTTQNLTAQRVSRQIRNHKFITGYVQKWAQELRYDFTPLKAELDSVALKNEILFLSLCEKRLKAMQKAFSFNAPALRGRVLYGMFQKINILLLAIIPYSKYSCFRKIYKNSFLFTVVHRFLLEENWNA